MNCATDGTNNVITLETVISDLDYADDICLLEDNADDAQSLKNRVVAAAIRTSYYWNKLLVSTRSQMERLFLKRRDLILLSNA